MRVPRRSSILWQFHHGPWLGQRGPVVRVVGVVGFVGVVTFSGSGCSTPPPDAPVDYTTSVCCTVTSPDRKRSAGCRVAERCRKAERVWMSGAVRCGPVDAPGCRGGRCCTFTDAPSTQVARPRDPVSDWEPAP